VTTTDYLRIIPKRRAGGDLGPHPSSLNLAFAARKQRPTN